MDSIRTPSDPKVTVILFAAFSVMTVIISAVGYFAISPLQVDIARLKGSAATIVSRDETNERNAWVDRREEKIEREAFEDRSAMRRDLDARLDAYKADLNARIAEINRILDEALNRRRHDRHKKR